MCDLPTLYEHQELMRDRARSGLTAHKRVILSAPPGTGKTRIAKWILGAAANREPSARQTGNVLFAVHKRGLVDNASNSFREPPEVPHGVVMSGEQPAWGHRVQVASIDTLLSWFIKGGQYDTSVTFDLVIFDECHSHHSKIVKFLTHHDAMRAELGKHPAYLLGLTATPQAKGLADLYADIVPGPSPQWLIDNGFLCPFQYIGGVEGKLDLLKRHGREFTKASEAAAMDGMAGDLVRDWKKHAYGRPTVGFFPRRSHALDAQQELAKNGIRSAYVDGDTPDDERAMIFNDLHNHRIDYLCNVQVVERGTDIPAIACVQLCVAVASRTRLIQMLGRGSRMDSGERRDGPDVSAKEDCLVIDHGGSVSRLSTFFEDDPMWTLDMSRSQVGDSAERPVIECPQCPAVYRGGRCKQCGYEPTKKERKDQGLEFMGDELRPITKRDRKADIVRPDAMMVDVLYRMGQSGKTWKQAVGLYYRQFEKQGRKHRIPKTVTVGGHKYEMLRYGSDHSGRSVASLFPFTVGKPHGGDYHRGKVSQ